MNMRLIMILLVVGATSVAACNGAITGRSRRFFRHGCKHNPNAARSDLHASDGKNEAPELLLRRVRPVSDRGRSVCGRH